MTLRNRLGEDVHNLFEQLNTLLDNEDALIVLFDGRRMVSYAHGFAASPSQLELLDVDRTFGSQGRRWAVNQQEGQEEP